MLHVFAERMCSLPFYSPFKDPIEYAWQNAAEIIQNKKDSSGEPGVSGLMLNREDLGTPQVQGRKEGQIFSCLRSSF